MKVVFCIYNFINEKLPLQPWLTINEIACRLNSDGHEVHIVTDIADSADSDLNIHAVSSLRGSNKEEIFSVIDGIAPDVLVTLITPLNLATGGWVSRYKETRVIAFSSYPFYSFKELVRALPHVKLAELKSYLRHLLVPGFLWKSNLIKYYSCVICQSDSGKHRLSNLLGQNDIVHSIQPGINLDTWKPLQKDGTGSKTLKLLYLGTASDIRGFNICLQAYKRITDKDISLTILARGAAAQQTEAISAKLKSLNIEDRCQLIGGWINREEMIVHINASDLVVLPFVLVPSELPVSVMEVIACGTPVITTDIDGLPSTVGEAGVIVKQGSVTSLKEAIIVIYNQPDNLDRLKECCVTESAKMHSWDVMCDKWIEKMNADNE